MKEGSLVKVIKTKIAFAAEKGVKRSTGTSTARNVMCMKCMK
jgi:hypothetical protein